MLKKINATFMKNIKSYKKINKFFYNLKKKIVSKFLIYIYLRESMGDSFLRKESVGDLSSLGSQLSWFACMNLIHQFFCACWNLI